MNKYLFENLDIWEFQYNQVLVFCTKTFRKFNRFGSSGLKIIVKNISGVSRVGGGKCVQSRDWNYPRLGRLSRSGEDNKLFPNLWKKSLPSSINLTQREILRKLMQFSKLFSGHFHICRPNRPGVSQNRRCDWRNLSPQRFWLREKTKVSSM